MREGKLRGIRQPISCRFAVALSRRAYCRWTKACQYRGWHIKHSCLQRSANFGSVQRRTRGLGIALAGRHACWRSICIRTGGWPITMGQVRATSTSRKIALTMWPVPKASAKRNVRTTKGQTLIRSALAPKAASKKVLSRQLRMPCVQAPYQPGLNGYLSAAPRSAHPGGVNAAFVDGHVVFLPDSVDEFAMAYAVSVNDGANNHSLP